MVNAINRILPPSSRIWALLVVFVALSVLYSIVVPLFEASDELWHYPMVKYIADNWALPVQDAENVGPWRQEGSQPPLYYFVGAVVTFWIDTSDMDVVRHLNPHADNGIATPDGNINLITHHPSAESLPWNGTTLAVHLIRFLSVLMDASAVYLTYRLALELIPNRPNLALIAAAVHAFTPMFVFISGAVNNDNLVIPLCSLALLLMVRIVKSTEQIPGTRLETGAKRGATNDENQTLNAEPRMTHDALRFAPLGIVVGLALLTKESAGGLVLLTALTLAYASWRERSLRMFLVGGVTAGGATLLIAGWWYMRNWRLYNDPTGQNVFIKILGQRDVPADLTQLWRERVSFLRGYWGNFGGLNVPMAEGVYAIFDILLVLATIGLLLNLFIHLRARLQSRRRRGLAKHTSAGLERGRLIPWFIVLLWPVLVVALWITWATTTWSSQGRLIFSAISVWSLLLALGWQRLTRLLPQTFRLPVLLGILLFMFVVSLIAPFVWIKPAYARPSALTDAQITAIPRWIDAVFFHPAGGQLKLLGYDAPVQATHPGQQVPVTLYWEAIEPFDQDYSIFLHLVDAYDLVVAQRDAFPGMGTLSTQWLTCRYVPGETSSGDTRCQDTASHQWSERRVITLPESAFSPNQAVFEVGLYDFHTGERLAAAKADGQIVGEVRFGQLEIQARPGDWPNPIAVDFGGKMELAGYDLDRRALRQGEAATLTLYWRGQQPMRTNYSISTQFVDKDGVKAAQVDAWPFDGALPTSLWEPEQVVEEARELVIFDGAPPGVYQVYVAVYPSEHPEALLVVTPPGGRLQTDHVVLTKIRVFP